MTNHGSTKGTPAALTIDEVLAVLSEEPDNYTVQSCCICYGGNSFPGPMREALKCHLAILQSRFGGMKAARKKGWTK